MRKFVYTLSICVALACALAAIGQTAAVPLSHATAFSLERGDGFYLARVSRPWNGAAKGFTYVFYPRGGKKPDIGDAETAFFQTPVRSAVTFSSTYLAALEQLGKVGSLVGVDSAAYAYSEAVRARIGTGAVKEVTSNWAPNVERLLSLSPDVVFAYGTGNEWDVYPKLSEAGLPVAICAEWMENDPLGRAEWIKFFALFYGESAKADAQFAEIEKAYAQIKSRVQKAAAGKKPRVLVNAPFQGSWNVSGGQSYMARFIADSGGQYLWSDDPGSGGLTLSVEAVYAKALDAEVWLNPGTAENLAALKAMDPRFSDLRAFKSGEVWNNTLRTLPSGANDYFESAVFKPQLVLADLAAIINPQAFPGQAGYYYKRVR
jgi:iron complex transport system substrate-binding protein